MPVTHVVSAHLNGTDEQVEELIKKTEMLKGIEGVLEARSGRNFTTRSHLNWVLVVVLKDKESLQVYSDSPIHAEFRDKYLAPIRTEITAVDFEHA